MDLQASCFALYLFCMTNDLSMIENIFYDLLLSMFFICEYCVFLVLYLAGKVIKFGHSFSVQLSLKQHPKRNICPESNRQVLLNDCLHAVSYLRESDRKVIVSGNRNQVCLRIIQRRFIVKISKSSVKVQQYLQINVCTYVSKFNGKSFSFKTINVFCVSLLLTRHVVHYEQLLQISSLLSSLNSQQSLSISPVISNYYVCSDARLPASPTIALVITGYNQRLQLTAPVITSFNHPLYLIAPVINENVHPDVPVVTLLPIVRSSNISNNDSDKSKDEKPVENLNQSNVVIQSRDIESKPFKVCNALQRLRQKPPSVVNSIVTPKNVSADVLKLRDKSIKSKSFKGCNVFKRFRQQPSETSTTKTHSSQHQEIANGFSDEYNELLSFINQAPLQCEQASNNETVANPYMVNVDPYMEKVLGVVNQPQFGGTLSPEMLAYPILEHLEFKTYLGGGAFGRVYKTLEKANSEIITLKVVQNSVESDDEVTFMQELRGHQNIVEITWVHHTSQFTYIAMKNHGEQIMSLSKYVAKAPQINEDMLSVIGRQVASGLSFINSLGIAHLDLKEDNCIINEHLEIRIIDFGLSMRCRIPHIEEPHYRYGGTMHYMSPECINETGYYGPEVDSWSFGVMLYTMFTGSYPFHFNDNGELDLPFYSKYPKPNRVISSDLKDLLDGIFERNIFERITSQEFQSHNFLRKNISLHQDYLSPFF